LTIGLLNGAVLIEFVIFAGWRERAYVLRAARTFRLERLSDFQTDSPAFSDSSADNEHRIPNGQHRRMPRRFAADFLLLWLRRNEPA
jgi:hypothetical protein